MKLTLYISLVVLANTLFLLQNPSFAQSAPGDVQYKRESGDPEELKSYPPSIFQHWIHRIRYRCDACHDRIFEMKSGATPVTHDLMDQGNLCSTCHNGKVAFDAGFKNCNRCHVSGEK